MNTNRNGVTENAFSKIDLETFGKNLEEIFPPKKDFCDKCEKRITWCECEEHEKENE